MTNKPGNQPSRLPQSGEREFTGVDTTAEVAELLKTTARSNPETAAAIDAKRAELDATMAKLRS